MFDIMCMQYAKKKNDASIHWFSVQFSCIVAISTSLFMDMKNHTVTGQDRPDKLKTVPLFNVLIHIKMIIFLEDWLTMYSLIKCIVNFEQKSCTLAAEVL